MHRLKVHNKEYRQSEDIFQTVKTAKLLYLMESGEAEKYKVKSFVEIDPNLKENIEIRIL